MDDRETKMLKEAYLVVLKEFEDDGFEDDGSEEDSWWWEEGRSKGTNQAPTETDYSIASQQHKSLAPDQTQRPFNAYEQCNKLILSCDSRRQVIQHFCNIIDELTAGDEDAQRILMDLVNKVSE